MSKEPNDNHPPYSKKALLAAILIIPIVIIFGLTAYDLTKSPMDLYNELFKSRLNNGYDIVCNVGLGMQLCMMNHTKDNFFLLNHDQTAIGQGKNLCLNVYLKDGNVTKDYFNIDSDMDAKCNMALMFKGEDGWTFSKVSNTTEQNQFGIYEVGKIRSMWWEHFWPLD